MNPKNADKDKRERCAGTSDRRKGSDNVLAQEFGFPAMLRFACPTMAMMLFMGLYTLVDTVFVSRYVNTDALSAMNIVCPVVNSIVGLGTMLATGGSAIIAKKMGEGKDAEARGDFSWIILCGVVLGIFIAVTGAIFVEKIIWRLGASEILFSYCRDYLSVLLLFTPASMMQVLFQNLLVAVGRPGLGMALSVGAGMINIAADYVFIVWMNMGIVGAAAGTGTGYLLVAVVGTVFFLGNDGTLRLCMPSFDWKMLGASCLNGASEMVSQMAAAVTTFLFNRIMMRLLGENGVAAITILIYTQFLLTTVYIGFSMGVAPVISYNYGSGNEVRLRRLLTISIRFVLASSMVIFMIAKICGNELASLFALRGTEVYEIASEGFRIFSFSFLFSGMNILASAMYTALSKGKISAAISFLRTFGLIVAALMILPDIFGVAGVWAAVPVAEVVTAVCVILLVTIRTRREKRVDIHKRE